MAGCLLCDHGGVITRQDNSSRTIYNCGSCGVYLVSDLVVGQIAANVGEIKSFLRHRRIAGSKDTLLISFDKAKLDKDYLQMTVEQIVDQHPKSFSEQMEMALHNLALLSRYPGDEIRIENLESGPLFYLRHDSFEALSFVIKAMMQKELIEVNYYGASFFPCSIFISPKGWDTVSGRDVTRGDAQSRALLLYDAASETAETIKSALQKAAKDCKTLLLTGSPLSKEGIAIGAELAANIKLSDFVFVDLSATQPEIYYGMGFAQALRKQVCLFCHQKDRKKLRLDSGWTGITYWEEEKRLQLEFYNFIKSRE